MYLQQQSNWILYFTVYRLVNEKGIRFHNKKNGIAKTYGETSFSRSLRDVQEQILIT